MHIIPSCTINYKLIYIKKKIVIFGYEFNKSVYHIPNSVLSITFGHEFKKSIDNLPNSVTSIIFDDHFNKSLKQIPKLVKICNVIKKAIIYGCIYIKN